MSLTSALNSALSGLRATQAGLGLVANNVANADTPGYTRKVQSLAPQVAGGSTVGVKVAGVIREFDLYLQRQLRTEMSGSGYADIRAGALDRLQRLFGAPGSDQALDAVVNRLGSALDALVTSPDSASARAEAVQAAQLVAQSLNSVSGGVQALRTDADQALRAGADRANELLQGIADLERRMGSDGGASAPLELLDERDRMVGELARLMDIQVARKGDGGITIHTTSGITLLDGQPASLRFDGGGAVSPEAAYSQDPAARTLGTIVARTAAGEVDLLAGGGVRSGELRAHAELRDEILVEAQAQLDELAASLAEAFGTRTVADADASDGLAIDIAGLARGNSVSFSFSSNGQNHTVTLVNVADPGAAGVSDALTAEPGDVVIGVDFSDAAGFDAAVAAALAAHPGLPSDAPAVTLSGATLAVADAGAATATAVSARITATGFTGQGAALPLFVDAGAGMQPYTGEIDGVPQRLGFAGRIAINPALVADPAKLVVYGAGTLAGDDTRPLFLRDAFEAGGRLFRADTGIGGVRNPFTGSISAVARQIVDLQGRNAEAAARVAEGQQIVVTSLADRFAESSGVDIDDEMAKLLQLQTAYAANARVMTAVKEMLDQLLRL